jgi:hypothetical protein
MLKELNTDDTRRNINPWRRAFMSKENKKLLRTKGAADLLGISVSGVRLIEARGLLHAVRDWSGHRRFEEAAVLEFKERLLDGEFNETPPRAA